MKASVIGAGSWGSTFALHLGRNNIPTQLWIREKEVYREALRSRENKTFLPGFFFPETVSFHTDLASALQGTDIVFIVIPSKFCREIYREMVSFLSPGQITVSLTKGIEKDSLKRMSEVLDEMLPARIHPQIAALSGPSFAREVAGRHPTAAVIAAHDIQLAKQLQHLISNTYFRAYASDDIIGVELAGALKNVIAIATGICYGLEYGTNSVAALITRGIAEITRLGVKLGAKKETFAGLAGIGDLVLTCTGKLSRNRALGFDLGKGKSLEQVTSQMQMVAEGVTTTQSGLQLARKHQVEMPIIEQVYAILYENKAPRDALFDLMSRELKGE